MDLRIYRFAFVLLILIGLAAASFATGFVLSSNGLIQDAGAAEKRKKRIIYPKQTRLDLEGLRIDGELRSPGEFYFQYRESEKFGNLVGRRKQFHREMLRDVVLSK